MPKIQFTTNIPVELRLQSIEGELTPSQFGGNQIKFTAYEGPFWVSEAVGSILIDQIRKKRIQPHFPVEVARREIAQSNGRKGIQWTIDLVGFIPGAQPDGTFAVAASGNGANGSHPPAPSAAAPEKSTQPLVHFDNNTNGNANGHPPPHATTLAHSGWAASLRDQTQALIDVYADCLRYSARHEGLIKSEDVRSLLLSAFINVSKTNARCYCPHSSTSRRRMATPMEARDDVSGGPGGGEIPPPLQSPLAGSHPDRWPAGGQATHRHRDRRAHAPVLAIRRTARAGTGPSPITHHPTPITGADESDRRRAVPLPGAGLHGLPGALVVQVRPGPARSRGQLARARHRGAPHGRDLPARQVRRRRARGR